MEVLPAQKTPELHHLRDASGQCKTPPRSRRANDMKTVTEIMESLIALQDIKLKRSRQSAAAGEEIAKFRSDIPEGVLGHFDRLLARGKKGVAIARNGVCCECHLKISSGTWANLPHRSDIHLCDSCGRYLYLPPETEAAAPEPAPAPAKPARARKKKEPALV
jgi:predicted  nucleic acid-binding Zn-ribbon protein